MRDRLIQDEGRALARQALTDLQQREIPPTPENYEIWLTHLLAQLPQLSEHIASLDAGGEAFSDAVMAELHRKHFSSQHLQDALLRTGSAMSQGLEDVKESLAEASRNTEAYGRALEGASGSIQTADAGRLQSLVGVLMDATERMRRHSTKLENKLKETSHEVRNLRDNLESVRKQALTDALTGIANRKRLEELLEAAERQAEATGEPLCVAIGDIDHFKRVNDTWGHQTGDQVIRFVAQSLVKASEDKGEVGRYGGEEFVIVLPGVALDAATEVAEQARKIVEKKRLVRRSTNEDLGNVTISMGVAELAPGEDVRAIISRADALLYQAKRQGRNRICTALEQTQGEAA